MEPRGGATGIGGECDGDDRGALLHLQPGRNLKMEGYVSMLPKLL